jgi:uncharacterized membrane protein YkgB
MFAQGVQRIEHPRDERFVQALTQTGTEVARYGVVLILLLIGGLKFTHAEAVAIQPLIAHCPLLFWLYGFLDVDSASRLIGTTEIVIALLISARAFFPIVSAFGSALGAVTFLTTTSFLFSTPGVWDPQFPALSSIGAFLIKDIVLLGACLFTAGEALRASSRA